MAQDALNAQNNRVPDLEKKVEQQTGKDEFAPPEKSQPDPPDKSQPDPPSKDPPEHEKPDPNP